MLRHLLVLLFLSATARGCVVYEYEHEIWLRVDGSGTINVTGRPGLWTSFKGLSLPQDVESGAAREAARALFERSGLRVQSVTLTHRAGQPYLFVSAAFDDVNRLAGTPAFPDLQLSLKPEGERLRLEGAWSRPAGTADAGEPEGLMAVRLHLPSKVYTHKNAFAGVERGNIVGWRQDVSQALAGRALEIGALIDRRSILGSTVTLFASAILLALGLLALGFYLTLRRGRRQRATDGG